jgi:hypothetical protein
MLGWITYKIADMYDRKREKEYQNDTTKENCEDYSKWEIKEK